MKKKIKNIIILIIIIILVIISVAFIKNRILLYNVKNNYFKALLDLKRSGNFHIIVNVKYAEREYDSKTEFIVKDGVEVRNDFSEDSDNYDCSIDMNENILINHNAKNYYKLTDREQSGYTGFGNAKFDPSFCLNNYQNANIKNVKYGSYKGKEKK